MNPLTLQAFPTCGQSILLRPKNSIKNETDKQKRNERNIKILGGGREEGGKVRKKEKEM